jgi:hypothetical protein
MNREKISILTIKDKKQLFLRTGNEVLKAD